MRGEEDNRRREEKIKKEKEKNKRNNHSFKRTPFGQKIDNAKFLLYNGGVKNEL